MSRREEALATTLHGKLFVSDTPDVDAHPYEEGRTWYCPPRTLQARGAEGHPRPPTGGRAPVRRALDMAALVGMRKNDVVRAHYQHLRAAGKPPKVALVACMRKLLLILNAMVRTGQPWQPKAIHT